MKKQHRMCYILSLCILTCGLSLAQEGKTEESRIQAIQNIRKAREDALQKRTLEYYLTQECRPQGNTNETASINTGIVILAGRILRPPYHVDLGKDFISINGITVEPRFTISGRMYYENLPETTRVSVANAELIARKREMLYKETGNYALVISQLVSFAKSLNGVRDVRSEGDMVIVMFVSNGITNEVGYICREMRKPSLISTTNILAQEYLDICSWLRDGKCVFVPMKAPPIAETPAVVNAITGSLNKKPNPKATRQELEREIDLVSKCFAVPISEEDAVVIIANWYRSDPLR